MFIKADIFGVCYGFSSKTVNQFLSTKKSVTIEAFCNASVQLFAYNRFRSFANPPLDRLNPGVRELDATLEIPYQSTYQNSTERISMILDATLLNFLLELHYVKPAHHHSVSDIVEVLSKH